MISCDLHDKVEIACMFRYPVNVVLKTGFKLTGTAVDTQSNDAHEECIKLDIDKDSVLVELNSIRKVEVRVDNPHFRSVDFS